MTSKDYDLPLGAIVTVTGVVIGRSEFAEKGPTYLVQYDRQGRTIADWFAGEDLDEVGTDGDGV